MPGQREQILQPLTQRGDGNGKHIQAVIEILAERALAQHLVQISVRCRYDPNIHRNGSRAAHTLDHMVLKGPQEPHLRLKGKLPELVEKQRAAVGQLKFAPHSAMRPGEGPFLVPEQRAVHERLRDGPAIDLDEGLAHALRSGLDRVGDKLLARAGFPEDQHRRIGPRQLAHRFHDVPEPARSAYELGGRVVLVWRLRGRIVAVRGEEPLHLLLTEHLDQREAQGNRQQAQPPLMLLRETPHLRPNEPQQPERRTRPLEAANQMRSRPVFDELPQVVVHALGGPDFLAVGDGIDAPGQRKGPKKHGLLAGKRNEPPEEVDAAVVDEMEFQQGLRGRQKMVHDHPFQRERLFQELVERDERFPDVRHGQNPCGFVKKNTILIRIRHIILPIGL